MWENLTSDCHLWVEFEHTGTPVFIRPNYIHDIYFINFINLQYNINKINSFIPLPVRLYSSLVSDVLWVRVYNGRDSCPHRLLDTHYAHLGNVESKLQLFMLEQCHLMLIHGYKIGVCHYRFLYSIFTCNCKFTDQRHSIQ